jgi:hypothetical protein
LPLANVSEDVHQNKMTKDVALSCNPSYWEARTVGWLEVENLQPMVFGGRTMIIDLVVWS